MTNPPSTFGHPPTRKATLYCPNCGHESPITGDWNVLRIGNDDRYRCPECTATITTRPRSSSADADDTVGHCYANGD